MSDNKTTQQRQAPGSVGSDPLNQAIVTFRELLSEAASKPEFHGTVKVEVTFQHGRPVLIRKADEQTIKLA